MAMWRWAEAELDVAPLHDLARIVVPRHDGHAVAQRQKRAAGLAERVRILEVDPGEPSLCS